MSLRSLAMPLCILAVLVGSWHTFADVSQNQLGAAQTSKYLHLLKNKSVGLVVNQTAKVGDVHLVDLLIAHGINVRTVFAPEHGFRGNKGAGETIADGLDPSTQLPIMSLYGKHKKPTQTMLENIDILVFDIQDVGVRFYTYISTMHYVMEAAAELGVPMMILDRPNPNIAHMAGPVLDLAFQSFVGMHPIPVLHGLTVGELALMIQGEQWIAQAEKLSLTVIPVADYSAADTYELPVPPSPNLPNAQSIQYYASLCLFEATAFSVGRGTLMPFQMVGHPRITLSDNTVRVTPRSTPHAAPYPKWQDTLIHATSIHQSQPALQGFDISLIERAFRLSQQAKTPFFTSIDFFDKLAGNAELRLALGDPDKMAVLKQKWQSEIHAYRVKAEGYFLYPRERAVNP